MKTLSAICILYMSACGGPADQNCQQVALGSSPAGVSPTGDVPISVNVSISDIAGPVIQEVCCADPKVDGCRTQTYTCDGTPPTAMLFTAPGYYDGNGSLCMVWETDGQVVARAWVAVD